MPAVTGLNHVAVMTGDLDRFIAFYTAAFGFEVVFRENMRGMRHAVLRIGAESCPDGMRGEPVLIVDSRLQGIHAPRPLH